MNSIGNAAQTGGVGDRRERRTVSVCIFNVPRESLRTEYAARWQFGERALASVGAAAVDGGQNAAAVR